MRGSALKTGIRLIVQPERAEAALWRRLRSEGDQESRRQLFENYAGLARSVAARRYFRRALRTTDRSDFEQFAFEGLLQAIDRFDPLRGVPFGAYAHRRIIGSIANGLARMSDLDAQFSHRARMEQERLRALARSSDAPDSLTALADLAMGLAIGLMLEGTGMVAPHDGADVRPTAYESLEWRELQGRLTEEVARLPEPEKAVLRQHYEIGLSFAQVAELLGLSRGRISQLHRSGIDRLRRRLGGLR